MWGGGGGGGGSMGPPWSPTALASKRAQLPGPPNCNWDRHPGLERSSGPHNLKKNVKQWHFGIFCVHTV